MWAISVEKFQRMNWLMYWNAGHLMFSRSLFTFPFVTFQLDFLSQSQFGNFFVRKNLDIWWLMYCHFLLFPLYFNLYLATFVEKFKSIKWLRYRNAGNTMFSRSLLNFYFSLLNSQFGNFCGKN